MLEITDGREKRQGVFGVLPLIPSAFSPAFSSCSLTTSFMCFHWGSPSPISWTLTSPPGLLPVLYLVILILTWSSAAWSGVDETKEGQTSQFTSKPISRATGWRECCLLRTTGQSVIDYIYCNWPQLCHFWVHYAHCLKYYPKNNIFLSFYNQSTCASIFGWKHRQQTHEIWGWWRWTECTDRRTAWKSWMPGYLAALERGYGCPWLGRWLFELPLLAAVAPGHLSPPNDQVVCPVLSPVSVLLVYDQTPLWDLLSLIPVGPTTQKNHIHIKTSH